MSPFFSVILPVYNVEAYLERCVHSIISQSFLDMEIILVDDGSTDASGLICDRYAARCENIRVIHKPNGGLSSARNAGLQAAEGEYIWFIDSDDWIEPGSLEQLNRVCADRKNDIVKFGYFRAEETGKGEIKLGFSGTYADAANIEALRRCALCEPGKYILSAWSHVYRRSFLAANSLEFMSEREVGSEDYLFNLLCLMHAGCVTVLDRPMYTYELRGGSLSQRYKPDLPARYTRLYEELKAHEEQVVRKKREGALLDRFYIWHLMFGSCIQFEYKMMDDQHSVPDGRKNVKAILQMPAFCSAIRTADRSGLTWKRRIYLLAMKLKAEPVFYWLYGVRKETRRRSGGGQP